jgi:hypothetical protein
MQDSLGEEMGPGDGAPDLLGREEGGAQVHTLTGGSTCKQGSPAWLWQDCYGHCDAAVQDFQHPEYW